jgi:hypothetical protein
MPAGHETEAATKTPVVIETSVAAEIAARPGKMRTRKASAKSAAHVGATKPATATESAGVATTKTAPVPSATAPMPSATAMRKRVDSQSAGESGSRS